MRIVSFFSIARYILIDNYYSYGILLFFSTLDRILFIYVKGGPHLKDIDYYELGKRIQLRRKELGLSQEAAAEQCGISPSFYSNIERGIKIMSLETFVSICKAFSISADYLLNDELPVIDEVVFNTIQEAKKSGTIQYEKYLRTIQALALVADHL